MNLLTSSQDCRSNSTVDIDRQQLEGFGQNQLTRRGGSSTVESIGCQNIHTRIRHLFVQILSVLVVQIKNGLSQHDADGCVHVAVAEHVCNLLSGSQLQVVDSDTTMAVACGVQERALERSASVGIQLAVMLQHGCNGLVLINASDVAFRVHTHVAVAKMIHHLQTVRATDTEDAIKAGFTVQVVVQLMDDAVLFSQRKVGKIAEIATCQMRHHVECRYIHVLVREAPGIDTHAALDACLAQLLVVVVLCCQQVFFLVCAVQGFVVARLELIQAVVGEARLEDKQLSACVLESL